jgi:hypothetical protein
MMRNALQLAVTGIEMVSKRYSILDLDGWSTETVRAMAKHDRSLARLYRKCAAAVSRTRFRRGSEHTSRPRSGAQPSAVNSHDVNVALPVLSGTGVVASLHLRNRTSLFL